MKGVSKTAHVCPRDPLFLYTKIFHFFILHTIIISALVSHLASKEFICDQSRISSKVARDYSFASGQTQSFWPAEVRLKNYPGYYDMTAEPPNLPKGTVHQAHQDIVLVGEFFKKDFEFLLLLLVPSV